LASFFSRRGCNCGLYSAPTATVGGLAIHGTIP